MSAISGPSIVKSGLILNLDFANLKSNKGRRTAINWQDWSSGTTGSTGTYSQNGDGNSRIDDLNPWGLTDVIWDVSNQDATSDGDGGFHSPNFTPDVTKLYRYSVFMKRKVIGNGSSYLGPHSNWSSTPGQFILNRTGAAENINPYWVASGWWGNPNQWYLIVGHVFPAGSGSGSAHPDTGIYDMTGTKISGLSDFMWAPTNTFSFLRSYLYYSTDTATNQQFYQPRVDICDGTQPTITQLLNNVGSYLYDSSGYDNHHLFINNPIVNTTSFTLDGVTEGLRRDAALTGASTTNTVVLWYSTTDTQELWVMGNNSGDRYLSASANNNYYHNNAGTPTNYVDLNVTTNPATPINYRNGVYHMWEAKSVNFTGWNRYDWFLYPGNWQLAGSASTILVYNRNLTEAESRQNYAAFRGRYGI